MNYFVSDYVDFTYTSCTNYVTMLYNFTTVYVNGKNYFSLTTPILPLIIGNEQKRRINAP